MAFPTSIPSYAGFTATHTLAVDQHGEQHNSEQADVVAIATKVGTGASTPTASTALVGNGTGTSTWRALTSSDVGLGNVSNVSELTLLQTIYPVGCIYTETSGTNPSTTFGFGTWVAFGGGRVLVGNGTSDQAFAGGASGGESNHTLVSNEMPSHNHGITDPGHNHTYNFNNTVGAITAGTTTGSNTPALNTSTSTTGITINNTGGGAAHNNLQPYIVVYFWRRSA